LISLKIPGPRYLLTKRAFRFCAKFSGKTAGVELIAVSIDPTRYFPWPARRSLELRIDRAQSSVIRQQQITRSEIHGSKYPCYCRRDRCREDRLRTASRHANRASAVPTSRIARADFLPCPERHRSR